MGLPPLAPASPPPPIKGVPHFPHTGRIESARPASTRFFAPQLGQTTIGTSTSAQRATRAEMIGRARATKCPSFTGAWCALADLKPKVRFELTTPALRKRCSTVELLRRRGTRWIGAIRRCRPSVHVRGAANNSNATPAAQERTSCPRAAWSLSVTTVFHTPRQRRNSRGRAARHALL